MTNLSKPCPTCGSPAREHIVKSWMPVKGIVRIETRDWCPVCETTIGYTFVRDESDGSPEPLPPDRVLPEE